MAPDVLATTMVALESDTLLGSEPPVRLPIIDLRQPQLGQPQPESEIPAPPETQTSSSFVSPLTSSDVKIHPYKISVNDKSEAQKAAVVYPHVKQLAKGAKRRMNHGAKEVKQPKKSAKRALAQKQRLRRERELHANQGSDDVSMRALRMSTQEATVVVKGRGKSLYDAKVSKMRHEVLTNSDGSQPSGGIGDDKKIPERLTVTRRGQSSTSQLHPTSTSATTRRTKQPGTSIVIHGPPSSTVRRSNVLARPPTSSPRNMPHQRQRGPCQPQGGAVVRREDDWTHWVELSVKVFDLPANITTRLLWETFSKEGYIVGIEIFEDNKGLSEGTARIRFSPPPSKAFWQGSTYPMHIGESTIAIMVRIIMENRRRSFFISSPVDPQVKYPEIMTMTSQSLDFGFMYEPSTMMGMYRVFPTPQVGLTFSQSMFHREIVVTFCIPTRSQKQNQGSTTRKLGEIQGTQKLPLFEEFRFCIPFAQLHAVHEVKRTDSVVLLISMDTPPNFFRKLDEALTHEATTTFWTSRDAWYRQTDIVYDPGKLKSARLTLKKTRPVIDIGRWTTYRFVFDMSKNDQNQYLKMCRALRDYNVDVVPFPDFKLITDREPAVWEFIDKPIFKPKRTGNVLDELISDAVSPLSFPVRYQLEVCISQGCLNEHNLSRDFVNQLMSMDESKAQDVLEYVATQGKRIFNPMEIFSIKIIKATVTPSTVYYNTPTVEISNRVVRQYAEYADRFLRVRFADEKFQGKIRATDKETMNEVFTRIKRAMLNGITIGDRHFQFLAFGNSQFRENGAYFFAPTDHLGVDSIRRWMGEFSHIKVVARNAARLGQCFSTTRAINGTKVIIKEIHDIKYDRYTFTDGVGKISKFLALMAASELGIPMPSGEPPSVFQFRLGGCKGILAVWPEVKTREIHIRNSQYKFPAKHEGLEIIRCSQFAAANLNRQLILVLSALGVQDQVFVDKLKQQLSNLEQAMIDEKMALTMLQRQIDSNQMTLTLAAMILEGFQKIREPFMISVLQLWRAWSIKYLKEKARITIDHGAFLFGCVDETRTLKGHYKDTQNLGPHASKEDRLRCLPEVFVQLSKGENDKPQVITGPLLLARNPSLHPGDIRVVRGVDIVALHHLKDVVVLPQTGDRDVPSMCSGGDLDGDDYLVMWDNHLMPLEWNHEPMDYSPPKAVEVEREVSTNDITSFFVTYMKNYSLPSIANAHCALADFMDDGVKDEKCLSLAALHSVAVDYVKTGVPARMPPELRPRKWPHFMEKDHKPKEQQYVSKKVLGKLYDQVERVDFVPEFAAPFDTRILEAYKLEEQILLDAQEVKEQYDAAMRRILAQHNINTEFEVWTTFVLHHANEKNDYKFHEEMGEVSTALKDRFRNVCYEKAGGKEFEIMAPFVAAMYKVTRDEMAQALKECREVKFVGGQEQRVRSMSAKTMPMMSFPWLFQGILGKIANGELQTQPGDVVDASLAIHGVSKKVTPKRNRIGLGLLGEEDTLETAEGVTHRGDVLELFQHDQAETNHENNKLSDTTQASEPDIPQDEVLGAIKPRDTTSEQKLNENAYPGAVHPKIINALDIERMINFTKGTQPAVTAAVSPAAVKLGQLIDFGFGDEDGGTSPGTEPLVTSQSSSTSANVEELLDIDIATGGQGSMTPVPLGSLSSDTAVATPAEDEMEVRPADRGNAEMLRVYYDSGESNVTNGLGGSDEGEAGRGGMHGGRKDEKVNVTAEVDSGGEEEEVLIDFDDKPSLLERLAKLNED